MKGFLTSINIKFQRTHDLGELVDIAIPYLPPLTHFRDKCAMLTHFAVEVRYPDAINEPSRSDVQQARDDAWAIYSIIEKDIRKPNELSP